MCTIIFAYGVFDGFAVASNRDEEYGRGFSPPSTVEHEDGWYIAPHDRRKGGTWLGYNSRGVIATVSNLPVNPSGKNEERLRSRGNLLTDLLREPSVGDALSELRSSFDRHDYAGFNIVIASTEDCFVAVNDADAGVRILRPSEGVHVVTNSPFDNPGQKARETKETVPPTDEYTRATDWLHGIRPLLASHGDPEVCVHDDKNRRGTTSSSLLFVPGSREPSFNFADGSPCMSSYAEYTPPKEF